MFHMRVTLKELLQSLYSLTLQLILVQLDTESESTSATMGIYEREAQLVIDYSELEAELRVRHPSSSLPSF